MHDPKPPSSAASSDTEQEERRAALLMEETWSRLSNALREAVQPEQFETWFRRAKLRDVGEECVELAVQNKFAADWLANYYMDILNEATASVFGGARTVRLVIDPELMAPERSPTQDAAGEEPEEGAHQRSFTGQRRVPVPALKRVDSGLARPARTVQGVTAERQTGGLLWDSDVVLNSKYTFDNFVVGPCNRFAHAAAVGAGEQPGKNYNPFFLHGSVGLGKTHLLQSVCFSILERWPDSQILYLSCETFVNHFIAALGDGDLATFRNKYRGVDVLVVDDIHLLANKERTQEEFFHTFNTLYNAGKQIVLSSDSPPKDIPTLQERLVSRFKWGMVTEILPPCYETRVAILKRKSREHGFEIPDEVCKLIAERIETNVRELEGAVIKLTGYAKLTQQKVTPALARETLRENFANRRGDPTLDDVVTVVRERFGVKLSDLQSRKRTQSVAYPRQIAMYLARQVTRYSLEEIGRFFGGRDHSTVVYAVEKISGLCTSDEAVAAKLGDLLEELQSRHDFA